MPSSSGRLAPEDAASRLDAGLLEDRRHADQLTAVVEFSADAIISTNRDGVITSWNRAAESLFGYTKQEIVGRVGLLLSPDDRVEETAAVMARVGRGEIFENLQSFRVRKDGTVFPVSVTVAPIRDQDGAVIGTTAIPRDVTEQRRAFEAAQHMAAIVENSDDAIISGTLDGTVTSWNPAAERMYGFSGAEVIGSSSLASSKDGLAGETHALLARMAAGQQVERIETTRVRKDGTTIKVSLTYSPIRHPDGTIVGVSTIARDLTEQQEAFEAAQQMAAIIEHSDEAIVGKTLDGIITSWNPAAERMYGYSSDEVVGRSIDLLGAADEMTDILARIRAGEHVERLETTRVRRDGTEITVALTVSPICDPDGNIVGVSTIARDLTEREQAARNAQKRTTAEDLVETVLGSAAIGIALAGMDGYFRIVNQSLCDLLGYDEKWFLTRRVRDMVHPDDIGAVLAERARFIAGSDEKSVSSLRLVRSDGEIVWVRYVVVIVRGGEGQPNLLMVQIEDVSAEHEAQETLAYQAIHDPLTGLHNRAWILDILKTDLLAAKREGTSVGTLFIDLDNFKVVNDSLGHAAGDEVLTTVTARIVAALRAGDRVGRFGGDEFVVVVQDVQDAQEVERCAERILASIAVDLQVRGHRIVPTASIGIAVSSSTSTPESLLRDTDSALARAKTAGRARWQFFDDGMHAQAVARLTVEDQLRDAISRSEFVVHYQPIVALADTSVVGHEALVRWAHPSRGLLSPGDFIEVAEDSGLITAIGAQVLEQVCALLTERPDLPGPISVNVSAVQLAAPGWLCSVTDTLTAHLVDPARLVIELTETAALGLTDSALSALETLSGLGVGIHLDDFGTGYSSISVLQDLPVTGVKLDLRFVHRLTMGMSQANALAQGLSGLVNGMHLTGIAEGIETQMQAGLLRAQGWECGQGYYFGRPAAIPVTCLPTEDGLIA